MSDGYLSYNIWLNPSPLHPKDVVLKLANYAAEKPTGVIPCIAQKLFSRFKGNRDIFAKVLKGTALEESNLKK